MPAAGGGRDGGQAHGRPHPAVPLAGAGQRARARHPPPRRGAAPDTHHLRGAVLRAHWCGDGGADGVRGGGADRLRHVQGRRPRARRARPAPAGQDRRPHLPPDPGPGHQRDLRAHQHGPVLTPCVVPRARVCAPAAIWSLCRGRVLWTHLCALGLDRARTTASARTEP